MKQIKAHIAVSLDGHTATLDKELDWLPREIKTSLASNTWKRIACSWERTPTTTSLNTGAGGHTKASGLFVVSHYDTNVTPDCGVEFLTEEPLQKVYELKQTHDILVVGGGKLITSLIKAELLDSLTIYTVPIMLGKGIGFVGETFGSKWKLSGSKIIYGNIISAEYELLY